MPPFPRTLAALLLTLLIHPVSAADKKDPWKILHADSHMTCEIPTALQLSADSHAGEALWLCHLTSPDQKFHMETSGFHNFASDTRDAHLNTRQYLTQMLLDPQDHSRTYSRLTPHYLTIILVDRRTDQKTLIKYWIAQDDANGYAIKSLTIRYPWTQRAKYDPWLTRIESTWHPSEDWAASR